MGQTGLQWRTIGAVAALLALAAWVTDALREPDGPPPLEAKQRAGNATTSGLGRYVVTARWGRPDGPRSPVEGATSPAFNWSGELSVDCGAIASVEPLAMESPTLAAAPSARQWADALGAIQQAPGRAKVAIASNVAGDWDGLRAVVVGCGGGQGASRDRPALGLHLQQSDFTTPLRGGLDTFFVVPAPQGQSLEVRIVEELDPASARGSRVASPEPAPRPTPFRRSEPLLAVGD